MRAVVFAGPGQVRVEEVPDPEPPAGASALVAVELAGICGTDLHLVRGDLHGMEAGAVIGHEFVGEVVAVGDQVEQVRPGDTVMASDFTACRGVAAGAVDKSTGTARERAFFGTGTSFGAPLDGAQAELVRVPHADTTLLPIPNGCSHEAALLINDNLATAWTALQRGRFAAGESVTVVGGGAVGQLVGLCAQAAGAGPVVVVEPNAERRRFSEAQGMLAASPDRADALVKSMTHGDGADLVVEAVGGHAALDAALHLVRRAGRIVAVGSHTDAQWSMPISQCFTAELSLSLVIGDSIRTRDQLTRMVAAGAMDPTVVIDARVPLVDAPSAYAALGAQQLMKAVIEVRR